MTDEQNDDLDKLIAEAAKALGLKIEPGAYAVPRAVVWRIVENERKKTRRAVEVALVVGSKTKEKR